MAKAKIFNATLKNGKQTTFNSGEKITVKGQVEYCHITSPLSSDEIRKENSRRAVMNQEGANCYFEDVNRPYSTIRIVNPIVVTKNRGKPTTGEQYVKSRFYTSKQNPRVSRTVFKNLTSNLPNTFSLTNNPITGMTETNKIFLRDEIAKGEDVLIDVRVYETKSGYVGLTLDSVTCYGSPKYITRKNRGGMAS